MPTRSLIEQIIYKYFRSRFPPKEAREEADKVMVMFDKEFISKTELREKLEEMKKKEEYVSLERVDDPSYIDGIEYNQALTDIKNLDILKPQEGL